MLQLSAFCSKSFLALAMILALTGCTKSPVSWWKSVNQKAKHLSELESKHEALLAEHERLKKAHLKLEHQYLELRTKVESKELAEYSLRAAGSIDGRGPASIHYEVPKGLTPNQKLALAYEHFRERRFSEAAITFEKVLHEPEAAALHSANVMYSAGVAWFELGNYKKAKEQLESARAIATGEEKGEISKKVELWMRVIDQKMADTRAEAHGG